jgi:hypothetical protein
VTELLRDLHTTWAWFVIIGNGMAGLWALVALKVPGLRTRALWWFTAIVEIAILLQVILGVVLISARGLQVEQFHMFYGFVAIIAGAIMYSYRQSMAHRIYLLYGLGGLFLMGLCIRAMLKA